MLRESGDVRGGQGVGFADFVWFCGIHSLGQVTDEELRQLSLKDIIHRDGNAVEPEAALSSVDRRDKTRRRRQERREDAPSTCIHTLPSSPPRQKERPPCPIKKLMYIKTIVSHKKTHVYIKTIVSH